MAGSIRKGRSTSRGDVERRERGNDDELCDDISEHADVAGDIHSGDDLGGHAVIEERETFLTPEVILELTEHDDELQFMIDVLNGTTRSVRVVHNSSFNVYSVIACSCQSERFVAPLVSFEEPEDEED